jgi:hypothetical protein
MTGEPMKFVTLADWTGMVEKELFAQTCKISSHLAMNRLASCKGSSSSLIPFAGLARGVNTPYRILSQPGY